MPQHISPPYRRKTAQDSAIDPLRITGSIRLGGIVQNLLGFRHLARCPAHRPRRRRPALGDSGDQFRTNVVTIESRIQVRRVFDPIQPPLPGCGQDFRPGNCEQRTGQEASAKWPQRGDATQSPHACAPQKSQHDRFKLIVGMMRREQNLSGLEKFLQRTIPNRARLRLEAFPGDRLHGAPPTLVTYAVCRGDSTAVTLPRLRIRMQSVIDVQRAHIGSRRQSAKCRQQDSGVQSTAECDRKFSRRARQSGQPPAETIQQSFHGIGGDVIRLRGVQPSL